MKISEFLMLICFALIYIAFLVGCLNIIRDGIKWKMNGVVGIGVFVFVSGNALILSIMGV